MLFGVTASDPPIYFVISFLIGRRSSTVEGRVAEAKANDDGKKVAKGRGEETTSAADEDSQSSRRRNESLCMLRFFLLIFYIVYNSIFYCFCWYNCY